MATDLTPQQQLTLHRIILTHAGSEVLKQGDSFDDLGYDSLDMIEAVMEVEEAFGIVIDETQIPPTLTVRDAEVLLSEWISLKPQV